MNDLLTENTFLFKGFGKNNYFKVEISHTKKKKKGTYV